MKRLLFAGLIVLISLSGFSLTAAQTATLWPTDGWLTTTPEAQGIDSAALASLLETLQERDYNLHSLLVIRHGTLVAEMYRYPYNADTLHDQRSVTKSNIATLVGIAIHEGIIAGVDAPLLSFFPNQSIANVDEQKQAITLEHLLTMSSGLDWNEGVSIGEMVAHRDWVAWMLDRPVVEQPGTRFNYSTGGSNLLAAVLEVATGQPLADYATARLYEPLGITDFQWDHEPGGHTTGGFGLHMSPRDMAKLGYLYLHQGEWDGVQVVPSAWVAAATSPQAPVRATDGFNYGYQWWLPADSESNHSFRAAGYGGQLIHVDPERDLVVVATAGDEHFDSDIYPLILEAMRQGNADAPLPENPEAQARLQAAIDALQSPQPQPVPELPEVAGTVSARSYRFNFAPFYSAWRGFDWDAMTLAFTDGATEALLTVTAVDGAILEIPIGLDHVPRLTDVRGLGPLTMQGTWTDSDTFNIQMQMLGVPEDYTLVMRFTDDEMRISFQEHLSGENRTLVGVEER